MYNINLFGGKTKTKKVVKKTSRSEKKKKGNNWVFVLQSGNLRKVVKIEYGNN